MDTSNKNIAITPVISGAVGGAVVIVATTVAPTVYKFFKGLILGDKS